MTRTRFLAAGLLLAAVVPLAACGGGGDPLAPASSPAAGGTGGSTGAAGSVKVGSADFPESALLGEIYAQALEAKGMTATRQFNIRSRETYLKAISGGEVADLAAHQADLTIGAPPEFKTRQQGLVGLKSVYNITPKEFRPLQSQATVEALKNGQVKAANIFSTDPSIAANGFVVLADPQSLFGSDNVVPLVRTEKADSVKTVLNSVSTKLDTAALADMVKQVVVDKKDASEVAKTWLAGAGLA